MRAIAGLEDPLLVFNFHIAKRQGSQTVILNKLRSMREMHTREGRWNWEHPEYSSS